MLLRLSCVAALAMVLIAQTYAQADLDSLFGPVLNNPENIPTPQPEPQYTCTGECVPYYLCSENEIITDGTGIIDIRVGADSDVESECPNYLDTCCAKKDVLDEPPETATKPPPPDNRYTCGKRNPDGLGFKITGNKGGESEYGEFPWMVAVLKEQKTEGSVEYMYQCGGSLIAPNVVLTAAHCVASLQQNTLLARAGEWDTQTKNELYAHQNRRVREVISHEQFKKGPLHNDVALLILDQPFDLAEHIQPVCLPPENHNFDGSKCFASGWGKNVFGKEGVYQVILKKVELPIVPHETCQTSMRTTRLGLHFILDRSFTCAGGVSGQDTCRGDGGSPLVCPIPGNPAHYYQAGIVAWGIGCGERGIPGVYSNVALFRNWIDRKLLTRQVEIEHYIFA